MKRKLVLSALAFLALIGCSSSSSGTTMPPQNLGSYVITISGFTFGPTNLAVPPGGTVTVQNQDSTAHTVTSEATQGAYTPGSVAGISFDTGAFTGTATFTIPASAQDGTVVPYFCRIHKSMMVNQGQLTISAAADGGTGGGGTPSPSPTPPGY